jgi:1-acyl-sn-glycerol-3-phosphate acyltransferase
MPTLVEAPPRLERKPCRAELPRRWFWLMGLFRRYARGYVRKHFHAVRLSRSSAPFPPPVRDPLLIVLNHPAWWDPLIGIVLASRMPDHDHFAAIDGRALNRYAFFRRLGFVGLDGDSVRGAAAFLRMGTAILSTLGRAFWVTAQGRFSDARERPLALRSGAGHLASRLARGAVLPIALEYGFWSERTQEALVRVGDTLRVEDHRGFSGKAWTALIEDALTRNLDALNAEVMTRDPALFTEILSGRTGIGGIYDRWRRLVALVRGRRFDPAHALEEARS